MNKRAEDEGKAVAVIIIILAFSIALYVILISPEERDKLLNEDLGYNDGTSIEDTTEITELLTETPGRLSPVREYGTRHKISSVNLFVKTEPKLIDLANSLYIKKSLFSKTSPKLRFDIEKIPDLNKIVLHFNVVEAEGKLQITINDREFFARELTPGIQLLEVPLHYLKERNIVEFSTSTGIINANEYSLTDVGIKQEFELINSREDRYVMIEADEKHKLQQAKLNYYMYCNMPLRAETTDFKIFLNNQNIHSTEMRCINAPQELEIDPLDLQEGKNTLSFILEEGDFSLAQISLETMSDELEYKTYYFTLSEDDYRYVKSNQDEIHFELLMEDDERDKSARVMINDAAFYMKTKESKYEMEISGYVQQGTNFLRLQPSNSFNVLGLRVYLEE